MFLETVPSLLAHQDGTEALGRFQELFSRLHPSSIRLSTESIESEGGASEVVATLVANCALERAIIRKTSRSGEPDSYSGGWYESSGNQTNRMLTESEAATLFQRLSKDVEIFLRRELALLWPSNLETLLNDARQDWEIKEHLRSPNRCANKIAGYSFSATHHFEGSRDQYDFSIEATTHEDPSKVETKVSLSRNGFSTYCYLKDVESLKALTSICETFNLQKFHLEEACLPSREMCK